MKTEPTESLSIKRANIVDKYLPAGDEQRYYERLKMHEELIDLINSHSPKIKQLEWVFYGTYYFCNTPLCSYSILQKNDFYDECVLSSSGHEIGAFKTLEEAESYAQADFEQRVKECLE